MECWVSECSSWPVVREVLKSEISEGTSRGYPCAEGWEILLNVQVDGCPVSGQESWSGMFEQRNQETDEQGGNMAYFLCCGECSVGDMLVLL